MLRATPPILLALLLVVFAWSMVRPHDWFTWALEISHRKCSPDALLIVLLFVHAVILVAGGHYTYALVPLGFGSGTPSASRAITTTASAISRKVSCRPSWRARFSCAALSFAIDDGTSRSWSRSASASARFDELLEWVVGAYAGDEGVAFLGTQGDG